MRRSTVLRALLASMIMSSGLALTACSGDSYEECLDYMRGEAVNEGIQMDHEDYARNRCTNGDGVTPDPDWRESL